MRVFLFLALCLTASLAWGSGTMINSFKWSNENGYIKIEELNATACNYCGNAGTQACNLNYSDKKSSCAIVLVYVPGTNANTIPNALVRIVDSDGSMYAAASQLNSWSGKVTQAKVPASNKVCLMQLKGSDSMGGMPFGVCSGGGIPPVPVPAVCSANNVTIDHGEVSSASLDGNVNKTNVTVQCSEKATVHLSLSNYNSSLGLKLAEGLYSKITIGGKNGDVGSNVVVNGTTLVEITSQLSTSGTVTAGSYSGVAVMVLDVL